MIEKKKGGDIEVLKKAQVFGILGITLVTSVALLPAFDLKWFWNPFRKIWEAIYELQDRVETLENQSGIKEGVYTVTKIILETNGSWGGCAFFNGLSIRDVYNYTQLNITEWMCTIYHTSLGLSRRPIVYTPAPSVEFFLGVFISNETIRLDIMRDWYERNYVSLTIYNRRGELVGIFLNNGTSYIETFFIEASKFY